jgi:hypothetical protein
MDVKALIAMLTDGLDPAEAAVVRKAIERDAVKAKASTWKQQEEYQALVDAEAKLKVELEGDKAAGKLGAKEYQKWYTDNAAAIEALKTKAAAYETKYGSLESPTPTPTPTPTGRTFTEDDIQKVVDARIQGVYAQNWSKLLKGTGGIIERHMYAKREKPINWDTLETLAAKYNGNLDQAYEEYDKPERDKAEAKAREDEVERRVTERIQKMGGNAHFPAAADAGPSALSARTKTEREGFDKTAFQRELGNVFLTGSSN